MHTPDGFVTGWICILMMLISAVPVALALRNLRNGLSRSKAASIAAVAAIIFLGQMLNFPIADGTSGHLIGAAFALLMLGTEGAVIAMASVLLVQALVFGDGGMLALGVNMFNMGIIGIYSADLVLQRLRTFNSHIKAFVASWASVVAASIAASVQLALSGTVALGLVLPAMVFTHSIIGFGEGFLTILMLCIFVNRLENPTIRFSLGTSGAFFLIMALLLPFASSSPDGMEMVAINLGFFSSETTLYAAPLPEYALPMFATVPYLALASAALIGYILTFIFPYYTLTLNPTNSKG